MNRRMVRCQRWVLGISAVLTMAFQSVHAQGTSEPAYKVNGKVTTMSEATKRDQAAFYDIEKKRYDHISEMAREDYLKQFWDELAKKKKISPEKAREDYLKDHVKVKDKEIKEVLEKFKDHPQLSKLSPDEQKKQVRDYLAARESQKVLEDLIDKAMKAGKIEILVTKPQEPIYDLAVRENEIARYGSKASDIKPLGCKGADCPITVVECSEFQCPFCSKMLPDTAKVLETYKGKIRWYVRDFPLDFHDRARPAAIAAKCASFQGKYWDMYYSIFANQKNLSDDDLIKRAEDLKLDMNKFNECYKTPKNTEVASDWKKAESMIQENFESCRKNGVEGTPAFFINGRRLSGALPFEEFKRVIDEELAKQKK